MCKDDGLMECSQAHGEKREKGEGKKKAGWKLKPDFSVYQEVRTQAGPSQKRFKIAREAILDS